MGTEVIFVDHNDRKRIVRDIARAVRAVKGVIGVELGTLETGESDEYVSELDEMLGEPEVDLWQT